MTFIPKFRFLRPPATVTAFIAVAGVFLACAGAARPEAAAPPAAAGDAPFHARVFDKKALGYVSCRIPGIAVTSRGTLLAWCEARLPRGGDWDPSNILLRRSFDRGATWQPPQLLAGRDGRVNNNPVMIAAKDGTIHFLRCVEYARCY